MKEVVNQSQHIITSMTYQKKTKVVFLAIFMGDEG